MGLVPHCLHLRLPFKSPSLSAIYFTKGDRCFINHCLINHSRIWNELIWTLKTNAGSGPGLDLSSFSFSPWLPRELPCALDMLRVPLKTMCVLLVLGGVSIMSMRASWLIINSSHVYPYWSSVYLSHQFLGEGYWNLSLQLWVRLFLLWVLSVWLHIFGNYVARCINI